VGLGGKEQGMWQACASASRSNGHVKRLLCTTFSGYWTVHWLRKCGKLSSTYGSLPMLSMPLLRSSGLLLCKAAI